MTTTAQVRCPECSQACTLLEDKLPAHTVAGDPCPMSGHEPKDWPLPATGGAGGPIAGITVVSGPGASGSTVSPAPGVPLDRTVGQERARRNLDAAEPVSGQGAGHPGAAEPAPASSAGADKTSDPKPPRKPRRIKDGRAQTSPPKTKRALRTRRYTLVRGECKSFDKEQGGFDGVLEFIAKEQGEGREWYLLTGRLSSVAFTTKRTHKVHPLVIE